MKWYKQYTHMDPNESRFLADQGVANWGRWCVFKQWLMRQVCSESGDTICTSWYQLDTSVTPSRRRRSRFWCNLFAQYGLITVLDFDHNVIQNCTKMEGATVRIKIPNCEKLLDEWTTKKIKDADKNSGVDSGDDSGVDSGPNSGVDSRPEREREHIGSGADIEPPSHTNFNLENGVAARPRSTQVEPSSYLNAWKELHEPRNAAGLPDGNGVAQRQNGFEKNLSMQPEKAEEPKPADQTVIVPVPTELAPAVLQVFRALWHRSPNQAEAERLAFVSSPESLGIVATRQVLAGAAITVHAKTERPFEDIAYIFGTGKDSGWFYKNWCHFAAKHKIPPANFTIDHFPLIKPDPPKPPPSTSNVVKLESR